MATKSIEKLKCRTDILLKTFLKKEMTFKKISTSIYLDLYNKLHKLQHFNCLVNY